MNINDLQKICVVGAGNMGHQISLCAALAGYTVTCTDINKDMLTKAENFARTYLQERVTKAKLSQEQADQTFARLTFTQSLEEALSNVDYVIEAAVEKLDIKRKLFAEMDRLAPPHAILATNSSFIVSSKVAGATNRPEKVCNIHFFNRAVVLKLL